MMTSALMSRVNKVIIAPAVGMYMSCNYHDTVLANGGVIACAGTHMTAVAARAHSVPLVCVCGLHILAPVLPHDRTNLTEFIAPSNFVQYDASGDAAWCDVKILDPMYDYIPPELVSLFITNMYVMMIILLLLIVVVMRRLIYIDYCRNATIRMILCCKCIQVVSFYAEFSLILIQIHQ